MGAVFQLLILAALPAQPVVSDPVDDQVLQAAHLATNGPGLVDYFRKRMPPGPEPAVVAGLLKKLQDSNTAARDEAFGALVCLGPYAIPHLRQAVNAIEDAERSARASLCLQQIEGTSSANVTTHAARALAQRQPGGAAAALLDYLPFAETPEVARELESCLGAFAMAGRLPDPSLLDALKDASPIRRAAAAVALCRQGPAHFRAVRPLLKDPRPTVRFRVALALVNSHDGEAVPILIDLLPELPPSQHQEAEVFLKELAGEWAVGVPGGYDRMARQLRREAWAAWWKTADGAQLLEEFRSRTLNDKERDRVADLIAHLDDKEADVREKAMADLVAVGRRATSLLRRASSGTTRQAAFAAKCLELIEREAPAPLPAVAARLLALRKPEGTLETLLAYLPCAETEAVTGQIVDLLGSVGFVNGQPEARLVQALGDAAPARRFAAAVALCRAGNTTHQAAIRRLLKDPDAEVRWRTAMALADRNEREAIPALIGLLADLPLDQAWEIDEYLGRLAGDKGPSLPLVGDKASRERARDAWAGWWREHGGGVDLTQAAQKPRMLGYLLVVEGYDPVRRSGRVAEYDSAGKLRWEMTGFQYPQHAEILPGDRVLIAEQNLNRVVEREFNGKQVWDKQVPSPFRVQRLRNGGTFIACRQQLVEFDRDGKEVFRHQRPGDTILAARKFRDGQVGFVTYQGTYCRLDATGKEIRTFRVPVNPNFGVNGGDVTQEDHVLVATSNLNTLAEYGPDGKAVWEASVPFPGVPNRLANGHTLVASHSNTRVTELDRWGKVVGERKDLNIRPWFASKR